LTPLVRWQAGLVGWFQFNGAFNTRHPACKTPVAPLPKGSVLAQMEEENRGGMANPASPGKWPLKQRDSLVLC